MSLGQLTSALRSGMKLVLAALREIFDEGAYRRFLARERMDPSCRSYREFRREHELAKARRPRCC